MLHDIVTFIAPLPEVIFTDGIIIDFQMILTTLGVHCKSLERKNE